MAFRKASDELQLHVPTCSFDATMRFCAAPNAGAPWPWEINFGQVYLGLNTSRTQARYSNSTVFMAQSGRSPNPPMPPFGDPAWFKPEEVTTDFYDFVFEKPGLYSVSHRIEAMLKTWTGSAWVDATGKPDGYVTNIDFGISAPEGFGTYPLQATTHLIQHTAAAPVSKVSQSVHGTFELTASMAYPSIAPYVNVAVPGSAYAGVAVEVFSHFIAHKLS